MKLMQQRPLPSANQVNAFLLKEFMCDVYRRLIKIFPRHPNAFNAPGTKPQSIHRGVPTITERPWLKLLDAGDGKPCVFVVGANGYIEDQILRANGWRMPNNSEWGMQFAPWASFFIRSRINRSSNEPPLIIDIGANVGYYSVRWATMFRECVIRSYEPGSYAFQTLIASKFVGALDNLIVVKKGLGDLIYTGTLHSPDPVNPGAVYNKGLASQRQNPGMDNYTFREEVQIVTLDSDLNEAERRNVIFIKIDAEGATNEILRGLEGTLANSRPPMMVLEVKDQFHYDPIQARDELYNLLSKNGYATFTVYSPDHSLLQPVDLRGSEPIDFEEDVVAIYQDGINLAAQPPIDGFALPGKSVTGQKKIRSLGL